MDAQGRPEAEDGGLIPEDNQLLFSNKLTSKGITVAQAKDIRESLGFTHLVIFGVSADGQQHVATHGETEQHAGDAAKAGNKLKVALGWPTDLCASKPVRRICKNCVFYKPNYGMWCFNGWSGDGSNGQCLMEPSASRVGAEHGCRHFQTH